MATHSSILGWRIPMDRGAWWAPVYGVSKTEQLSTAQFPDEEVQKMVATYVQYIFLELSLEGGDLVHSLSALFPVVWSNFFIRASMLDHADLGHTWQSRKTGRSQIPNMDHNIHISPELLCERKINFVFKILLFGISCDLGPNFLVLLT